MRGHFSHVNLFVGFLPTLLGGIRPSTTEPTPIPSDPPRPRAPAPDLLLRAVARLLRPLVRLLLQSGVTYPVLADAVRDLYVDVARTELLTDPKARTDSRVSLLTGVHRKELRRQRLEEGAEAEPPVVTRTSAVLARWLGSAAFLDAEGKPATLARSGPAPSFDALVGSVTRDVRPRTVLDELLGNGVVRLEGEAVALNADAFVPRDGDAAQMFYFARNLHDHLAAAGANVLAVQAPGGTAPFLDRAVHYDGLSAEAAGRLEAAGRAAAQAMLLDVNRTALAIADADDAARPKGAPTRRVNLGVYLFVTDETPP